MKFNLPSVLQRLGRRFLRFVGFDIEAGDKIEPDVWVALEREKLREQIDQYSQTLAATARLRSVLKEQLQKLKDEESLLRLKLQSEMGLDPTDASRERVLRLRSLSLDSADLGRQLQEAEATFTEISAARDAAIAKARQTLTELTDLAAAAKIQQSTPPNSPPPGLG